MVASPHSSEAEVAAGSETLLALLSASHGPLIELHSLVFRELAGSLARSGAVSLKNPNWQALRGQIVRFVERALSCCAEGGSAAVDAAASLARALILKAPDRVDTRAAAADLALAVLPEAELEPLVVFLARLSRTPKVGRWGWGGVSCMHVHRMLIPSAPRFSL